MSRIVYPLIGGRVARGTKLDSCGVPAWGDAVQVTSEGIVSVAVTANYDDGEEITVRNFAGKRCVSRDAEPELINLSLDITFCAVDPDFYTLVTGFPVIYDAATGDAIGYKVNRGVRPSDVNSALEVWASAQGTAACDEDTGAIPYGYLLWPFLSGGRVGDYTIENGAVTFTVSGMLTQDGSGWAEGPYLIALDGEGDPGDLSAVVVDGAPATVEELDHQIVFRTTQPPPEASPGLIPLDDPDTAAATTATAGSPGTFDGVRPVDLTDLQSGIVASPLTLWTTGQHVILGDGSKAHWDSNSFEANVAP